MLQSLAATTATQERHKTQAIHGKSRMNLKRTTDAIYPENWVATPEKRAFFVLAERALAIANSHSRHMLRFGNNNRANSLSGQLGDVFSVRRPYGLR